MLGIICRNGELTMKKTVLIGLIIVVLSFFGSICGQIGDLVASKLKRHYGIKDYSQIFPGHGGVLDRFDSIIFTSIILVVLFSIIKMFLV